MDDAQLPVIGLSALRDNYIWMFPTGPQSAAAVDPGEAEPVLRYLRREGLTLTHILLTHHHRDHTGGVAGLTASYRAKVIGGLVERARLPPLDQPLRGGEQIQAGDCLVEVLAVPGHTLGHLAYRVKDALFPGDTLFRFGCGRLFEGDPAALWNSLLKLRALAGATRVFPAHEYTLANLRFALALEPEHPELKALFEEACAANDAGRPTLPCSLAEQQRLNPFLRGDDPQFAAMLGLATHTPTAIFTKLRADRDHF